MGATMKNNKLVRFAAALSLAAAATLAVPSVANAYVDPAAPVVIQNNTAQISVPSGTFSGNETVGITVTGENASAITTAMVKLAVETNSSLRTQASNGAVNVALKFPADASGTYNVTLVGLTSGRSVSRTVATAVASGSGSTGTGSTGSGLPATGLDSGSLLGLWVGGGALVLAGGAIAVGATVRRQRNDAAA
jgi:LPXTG-motif cell wall-anchored protein